MKLVLGLRWETDWMEGGGKVGEQEGRVYINGGMQSALIHLFVRTRS